MSARLPDLDKEVASSASRKSPIEWIAGAIGLVLTLSMIGFIGYQALIGGDEAPAAVDVRVVSVQQAGAGFVVEIVASNLSRQTAAGVEVEGVLRRGGAEMERSSMSFDYVPGHSQSRGGLFFTSDPRSGALSVRPVGYHEP